MTKTIEDEMLSAPERLDRVRELALKQYTPIMNYMAYEGQVYWGRTQMFAALNVALIAAFVALVIAMASDKGASARLTALASVVGVTGFFLSLYWIIVTVTGNYWIERWRAKLEKIEPDAYGDIDVFRNADPQWSVRAFAKVVPGFISAIWILLLAALWCLR